MSTRTKAVHDEVKDLVTIGFKDPKKGGRIVLRSHKRKDGTHFKFTDEFGDLTAFTLDRLRVFDPSNKQDAKIIDGFRHHPVYAKHLVITSKVESAKQTVEKVDMLEKAFDTVKKMGKSAPSFARVLGIHVVGLSDIEVKAKLFEIAQADPKKIIDVESDPLYSHRVLLHDGLACNVFLRREGVFFYGETAIGNNEPQAIQWMQENGDLLVGIDKEIQVRLK